MPAGRWTAAILQPRGRALATASAGLGAAAGGSPAFRVSVGGAETSSGVEHPPTGLFQGSSTCPRRRDA